MNLSNFKQVLAKRVRSLREEKKLRQEDLEDYEISWKTVQLIEYGQTDVKLSTLIKLAEAFDMSVSELLKIESISS